MDIIIADSNDIARSGLHAILANETNITVVGEAITNDELISQVQARNIDIAIIDYTSPGFSIDVIPDTIAINHHIKVIAVTPEQNPSIILDALKLGVISYIKKDCDLGEIKDAVQETINGNRFFCGQILNTIRKASIDIEHLSTVDYTCAPILLSGREVEIIKYIAEGGTSIEIAELLHLSHHTVITHRKNIMNKLGIKNTAGLVMYAVKSNIVSPNKFSFSRLKDEI